MEKPPSYEHTPFRENFASSVNLLYWAVLSLSVSWTLMVRRFGTVGTRIFAVPVCINVVIQALLVSGTLSPPEHALLTFMLIATLAFYVVHIAVTLRRRATGRHVHSYNIGHPRLGGKGFGVFLEGVSGVAIGILLIHLKLPVAGFYTAVSSACTVIIAGMITERDRHRVIALRDAEMEQSVLVEGYDAGS